MSALAEALVAAQRRAISALEKGYVAGRIERETAIAALDGIGCTDAVDRDRLLLALDTIREPACAEREAAEWDTDPRDEWEQAREAFSEGRSIYDPEALRWSDEARPYPKAQQLSRGARRYRRKVASPKQWQAIIAAKQGPCRVAPAFVLMMPCPACNREADVLACDTCAALEAAEVLAGSKPSPQLWRLPVEYHHLVPRALGGDDVPDNIVPLSSDAHRRVTAREPEALRLLAECLTDAEYAYCIDKLGEGALERLFGVMSR